MSDKLRIVDCTARMMVNPCIAPEDRIIAELDRRRLIFPSGHVVDLSDPFDDDLWRVIVGRMFWDQ